ncbi:hypothetical protein J4441_00005 [Candidatus Micrarchaeota archaeon]|nr:hypothetical protein [Candidatus Micrarchaeota archaeon]
MLGEEREKIFISLKDSLLAAFAINTKQLDLIQDDFKKASPPDIWDASWSTYIDFVKRGIIDMRSVVNLTENKAYPLAFSSLRVILENLLVFRLVV